MTVVVGWWLDRVILKVSSNINDSTILWFYIVSPQCISYPSTCPSSLCTLRNTWRPWYRVAPQPLASSARPLADPSPCMAPCWLWYPQLLGADCQSLLILHMQLRFLYLILSWLKSPNLVASHKESIPWFCPSLWLFMNLCPVTLHCSWKRGWNCMVLKIRVHNGTCSKDIPYLNFRLLFWPLLSMADYATTYNSPQTSLGLWLDQCSSFTLWSWQSFYFTLFCIEFHLPFLLQSLRFFPQFSSYLSTSYSSVPGVAHLLMAT